MLVLLLLGSIFSQADGFHRFVSLRGTVSSNMVSSQPKFATARHEIKQEDGVFDEGKRKVYSGSNPLHNR